MRNGLWRWRIAALIAGVVIVLTVPFYLLKESLTRTTPPTADSPTFVGKERCFRCHEKAYRAWLGSDHDLAMAVASDSTVLGDFEDARFASEDITARFYRKEGRFFVNTQGPDGEPADFEITHTFGVRPLQQYLIPFPGGRLQALGVAWDTERGEWFDLYPNQIIPPSDWLHWTRPAQNWNGMCAECHSTNLVKNYDPDTRSFATTWSEIDVSCEACHGPGSRHVEWAEIPPMARPESDSFELVIGTSNLRPRAQVELCAPCHSRRRELGDYDHTSAELMDNIVPSILEEPLYFADGQIKEEVYVYGSFVQSKMFAKGVACSDCHDVHSLKLVKEGNDLCLHCHAASYDSYDHHFHKKEHKGRPSDGHLCVKCHMQERPYMVVDWRADHSFRVPRPDLTLEIGTPNACGQTGCHHDKPSQWSADHYRKWYGIARKPHYGTILAAGRMGRPQADDALIRLAGDPLHPAIVRATALSLLREYPGARSTAAFQEAVSDEEALVRYTAVLHLNTRDPREFTALLAPLLFDEVRAVRIQAASALAGLPEELFKPYQQDVLATTLAEYKETMEYSLDFAFAGHNLGNLYGQLRNPERAERYYRAATEIDDLFYPAKVNLAMLYNAQGRNEEALSLFREVLRDFPEEYEVEYSLGLLLGEMNRFPEAADHLERAARGLPDRARIYYNLGLIQAHLGRNAESALLRSVELEPQNHDFLLALAEYYLKRGELESALGVAEKILAAYPESRAGHQIKAHVERSR